MKSHLQIAFLASSLAVFGTVWLSGCGSNQRITPLVITPAALPNGIVETHYNQPVQVTGGVAPYHWSLTGNLPHNLQIGPDVAHSTTTIYGTPDTPVQGDEFTIEVTDSAYQSASQAYKVSILALPDTLTVSPAAGLSFNPQLTGTASGMLSATLSNSGTSPVGILGITASGTNAADFSQSSTCASVVPPSGSCDITVTFTPGQPGPRVASISINDDTVGSPHQVALNGIGLSSGANATPSAPSLSFPGQAVGTTSAAQALTLTNYGTATLNIASIAATGNFSATSTCGASLASTARCAINVSFAPSAMGALTGTLSISGNVAGGPQTVSLSGTGVDTKGSLTGSCFGTNAVGTCYSFQDPTACPAGTAATTPKHETFTCLMNTDQEYVDTSRGCQGTTRIGKVTGVCIVSK